MKKIVKKYGAFNMIMIASMLYGLIAAAVLTQMCPGYHWFTYTFEGFFNNIQIMTMTKNGAIITGVTMTLSFATGFFIGKCEVSR